MLFNSYPFLLIFLPSILLTTWLCLKSGTRGGVIALLVGSIVFYGYWKIGLVPLLLISIIFNFLVGRGISRCRFAGRIGTARCLLILGLGGNLALLGYYKYATLLLGTANGLLGLSIHVPEIILPIGISFFTFTQIAFLVDVWKGKADEYDPLQYALFVTYFPHLIAGPILHHSEMIPQFRNARQFRISRENIAIGLTIFTFGLAKKVLLADSLAHEANLVFGRAEAGDPVSFAYAWAGALSYSLQLYFDFSGYSDMAIGLSRMFGVALPDNFNSPYKAANIIDFWRRWHMTLSRFLRDYLYIPLGGNKHGAGRRYANLFITMLLGGLWHGASWTFALWGGLHGVMLIVNHLWRAFLKRRTGKSDVVQGRPSIAKSSITRPICIALTFLCVTVAWIPFRADGFPAAMLMLRGMFGLSGVELPHALAMALGVPEASGEIWGDLNDFLEMGAWSAAGLAICWFLPNTQQILSGYWLESDGTPRPAVSTAGRGHQPVFRFERPRHAIAMGLLFGMLLFVLGRQTHFLYFQF